MYNILKLFILTSAIVAVQCDTELVEEAPKITRWLWVLTPKTNFTTIERPQCSGWLNVTKKVNHDCTCSGSKAPLLEVEFPDGIQGIYPFIKVNTAEEIQAAINANCSCPDNATDRRMMGKLLDEDFAFFATCEPYPWNRGSVGCWPEVFAKSAPTLAKLQELMQSIKYINEDWKITCSSG